MGSPRGGDPPDPPPGPVPLGSLSRYRRADLATPGGDQHTIASFRQRSGWLGLASARLGAWTSLPRSGEALVGARNIEPVLAVYAVDPAGQLETIAASPEPERLPGPALAMAAGDLGGDGFDELLLLRSGFNHRQLFVFRAEEGHRVLREAGRVELPGLATWGPPGCRFTILAARGRVEIYDCQGTLHRLTVKAEGSKLSLRLRDSLAGGPPAYWVLPWERGYLAYRVEDPALQWVAWEP